MEWIKTDNLFTSDNSIAIDFIRKYEYPYMILPDLGDYIIKKGKTLGEDYELKGENIWIHKTANVVKTALIMEPAIIDAHAQVRHCAFIRENVILGKMTVLGSSCEIKNSILFDEVEVPHLNYVGDSILGYRSHMGTGSVTANLKSDKSDVVIRGENNIKTNLRKVGTFLGDNVEIGCNSVLAPGTIVGKNSIIYPLVFVRGVIPGNMIVKDKETVEKRGK